MAELLDCANLTRDDDPSLQYFQHINVVGSVYGLALGIELLVDRCGPVKFNFQPFKKFSSDSHAVILLVV